MRSYDDLSKRYKEVDFLEPAHTQALRRFMKDWSKGAVKKFTAENMATCQLAKRFFQVLVHTPPDPSDQVIVVPTGFGAGFSSSAVSRALYTREEVDPHATLVVQGSPFLLGSRSNFSPTEERALEAGDFQPVRDRLNVVLEEVGQELPDAKVAYAGASLGAAVVGTVLGHSKEMALGSNGGTIIDPANITNRSLARLGLGYARDFAELAREGVSNFPGTWLLGGPSGEERGSVRIEFCRNLGNVALGETLSLARALRRDRLFTDMQAAPKDVGIVHMWAKNSNISPDEANLRIVEKMKGMGHPLYREVRVMDPRVRHGITVRFEPQAAALRQAIRLSEQGQNDVQ